LTGAWLALAGLVATAGLRVQHQSLQTVFLALLLVEPVWGALWAQISSENSPEPLPAGPRLALPYIQGGSPAAGLAGWLPQAPVLVVAGLLAWLTGGPGLALTGLVALLAVIARLAGRAGLSWMVDWLQTLDRVTLPFGLGVLLMQTWPSGRPGATLLLVMAGFTLLARAGIGPRPGERARPLLLAGSGSLALVVALLLAGQMVAAGLAALLAAGPLLLLARPDLAGSGAIQGWWWLLALVVTLALALGAA